MLQAQVSKVSQDYGHGGMSILLSNRGLALRWPGDIDPPLAQFIRDLLLDIRERMLAYENKKAIRIAGETTGYRIAGEREAPAEVVEEEAARAAAES